MTLGRFEYIKQHGHDWDLNKIEIKEGMTKYCHTCLYTDKETGEILDFDFRFRCFITNIEDPVLEGEE